MASYFESQPGFLFEGLAIILCGSALWIILPFSWKVTKVFSWVILLAFFLLTELWWPNSLLSFCPLSAPFVSSWKCFCRYKILKNLMHLLFMSLKFTSLDKQLYCISFQNNPVSIPSFYWGSWGDPWAACLLSSKSPQCVYIHGTFHASTTLT